MSAAMNKVLQSLEGKDDEARSAARMSRKRILISAYACSPFHGSEPGVGWSWVRAVAADHDVTVLTAEFNREVIERADPPADDITFKYVPSRRWRYKPTSGWKF